MPRPPRPAAGARRTDPPTPRRGVCTMRAMLLVIASGIGSLGWGGVLPYQYAYAADTRDWGAFVAAAASSLFSIGALVAAPIAGRLSDRFPPVRVAVATQVI